MARRYYFTDAQIILALERSAGIQAMAAKMLEATYARSCSRTGLCDRIRRSRTLSAALTEILEKNLDIAEGQLLKQIEGGNTQAIIYYLSTQGKGRGYTKRIENTGPGGGPVMHHHDVRPDFSNMSAEDADQYLAARASGPEPGALV